jgi:hypothetical protein
MNAAQPSRFKSHAARVANLPSSPGEKAGRVNAGFEAREEEDDIVVDDDEGEDGTLMVSHDGVV